MEILKVLGIETDLFIAQVVNFLLLFFVLKFLLYKPIRKTMQERKSRIDQGLKDADLAKEKLNLATQERQQIIKDARKDADSLMSQTKASSEEVKKQTLESARKESNSIVDDAKRKAALEFESASKEVGKISIGISQKVLTKVLSDLFTETQKEEILNKAISKIETEKYEQVTN